MLGFYLIRESSVLFITNTSNNLYTQARLGLLCNVNFLHFFPYLSFNYKFPQFYLSSALESCFQINSFSYLPLFQGSKAHVIYRNKSKNSLIIDSICKLSIESVHYFFKPYLGNWDLIKYTFDNILRNHKFFYNMSLFYELISVYPFIKWHNSIYSLNSWKH